MKTKGTNHYRSSRGDLDIEAITRTWCDVTVTYTEARPSPGVAYADLSSNLSTIVICLDAKGGICEPRLNIAHATPRSRYDMGYFIWVPPNQTVWGYSENAKVLRALTLKFDLDHIIQLMGVDVDTRMLVRPQLMVYDARVKSCAHLLADTCLSPFGNEDAFGRGVLVALLAAFFHAAIRPVAEEPAGALLPWQLHATLEYLEANFTKEINLSELASLTRLSESRFARAFKSSTGIPPYAWVLKRRVKEAQGLLLQGQLSFSHIAGHVGFSDQSHFGKVFRRISGVTPRDWQRSHSSTSEGASSGKAEASQMLAHL